MAAYKQAAAARNENNQETGVLFPPPEGPYSAYLVFQQDEDGGEEEEQGASCWGCCNCLREMPFSQDKCWKIFYAHNYGTGVYVECEKAYFIPVLGQPLSSNCYYAVRAEGRHKGMVETCSTEEDMINFCCCRCVKGIRPRPLEPSNRYQQIQISRKRCGFTSNCVASDGFPPHLLRMKGWSAVPKALRGQPGKLAHVGGQNASLRAQLPPFNFSISEKRSPIVTVGEWYCPFIFINELGNRFDDPKIQLMESPLYKMELEKFWEEIYSTEVGGGGEDIVVQSTVRVEEALLFGTQAVQESRDDDGSVWIKGPLQEKEKLKGVRLSWSIIAKMRADEGRELSGAKDRDVRVKKSFGITGIATKFVCYVVVERYVLKRMDGSIVLTYSFRDSDQVEGRWG